MLKQAIAKPFKRKLLAEWNLIGYSVPFLRNNNEIYDYVIIIVTKFYKVNPSGTRTSGSLLTITIQRAPDQATCRNVCHPIDDRTLCLLS